MWLLTLLIRPPSPLGGGVFDFWLYIPVGDILEMCGGLSFMVDESFWCYGLSWFEDRYWTLDGEIV